MTLLMSYMNNIFQCLYFLNKCIYKRNLYQKCFYKNNQCNLTLQELIINIGVHDINFKDINKV